MKLEGAVKMGSVEVGVKDITSVVIQGSFAETVGSEGDVDREDGGRIYQGMRCWFQWSRRRRRQVIDI